jgi:hypothetical protein
VGGGSQLFLQIVEGLLCLLSPLELVLIIEELEKRESLDAESRDEPAQGSHAPSTTFGHHGGSQAASSW